MTEVMGFNIFDIVVIALILLLSIKGLLSGFTKELFSAIGLIGGLYAATLFNTDMAQYIYSNVTDALSIPVLKLIATVVIFLVVWYVASLIGRGFSLIGDSEYISTTSRLAGMFVKMVTLFFVFSLITFALSTKPQVSERFKDTLSQSKLYPLLKDVGAAILNISLPTLGGATVDANSTVIEQNSTAIEQNSTVTEQNSTQVEHKNSSSSSESNETNSSK